MRKDNSKVSAKGNPITLAGNEVKAGDTAPDFRVVDKDLASRSLKDYEGKIKVLAIYPSIDTGVCAAQNRKFNEMATGLSDEVVVLSISCDLPFAQSRFCAAEGLQNVVTLSDYQQVDFGLKYGFLMENLRLLARGSVVIDKENVVQHIQWVPEITDEPDYDAVLNSVKSLI
jgi:thioredoxin-dependent peroxiredoxin